MENGALGSYRNYPAQRRALERVLQKLREQDFPGAPYLEDYLRHLHRRDLTVNTLRAAFTILQGFLTFLKKQGKTDLPSLAHRDLEAFVEGLQDRGLKPLSVENNLRQVKTFLRYLVEGKDPIDCDSSSGLKSTVAREGRVGKTRKVSEKPSWKKVAGQAGFDR